MKNNKNQQIAGIDEAGRGPLAGPVVAACVILNPEQPIEGLMDSKKLTPKKREQLNEIIKQNAYAWGIGFATAKEIDQINILQASLLAMQRAVKDMAIFPDLALIDGIHCPKLACCTEAIIKGDATVPSISAASIIAKVHRDNIMLEFDKIYPDYGFAQHKGYPTKMHRDKLQKFGPIKIHRYSFAPVKNVALIEA